MGWVGGCMVVWVGWVVGRFLGVHGVVVWRVHGVGGDGVDGWRDYRWVVVRGG